METPPLERFFDLDRLGRADAEVTVTADADALKRLARWADVETVELFKADIALHKLPASHFRLDFVLAADIVQACVVTLEPVRSHIARDFTRELHLSSAKHRHAVAPEEMMLSAGGDEAPEEIASPHYDLAAPLLEELLLAIDPYPRAPGAELPESPDAAAPAPESPFAALKVLKERS